MSALPEGYASSQAYVDRYKGNPKVIPADADDGLDFKKIPGDVYEWLGFEASQLIFDFLKDVAGDETLELDLFAYDLNEPDIVKLLEKIGGRLRAIIDNSAGHRHEESAESQAAKRLSISAGSKNIKRMHFKGLQHNKVLIAGRGEQAVKVLFRLDQLQLPGSLYPGQQRPGFPCPRGSRQFRASSNGRSRTPGTSPPIRSPSSGIWCR